MSKSSESRSAENTSVSAAAAPPAKLASNAARSASLSTSFRRRRNTKISKASTATPKPINLTKPLLNHACAVAARLVLEAGEVGFAAGSTLMSFAAAASAFSVSTAGAGAMLLALLPSPTGAMATCSSLALTSSLPLGSTSKDSPLSLAPLAKPVCNAAN